MLKSIISGKQLSPFTVCLFSTPGVGKSTWASRSPKPIFLGFEENQEIDSDKFPVPKDYDEFLSQLDSLLTHTHEYKTIVIDTIDGVEKALHQKILASDPKGAKTLASAWGGYGAAFDKAASFLKNDVRDRLKFLRDTKGMNVIVLGHTHKKTEVDTINGLTYDSYDINLHHKTQSVFVDWVACCFFATYLAHKVEDDNSKRTFVLGEGERVLFTEKRPGYTAKNRYNLPCEMPLVFDEFYANYKRFFSGEVRTAPELKASIAALSGNIKDEARFKKVMASVEKCGEDIDKLELLEKRLREFVGA